MKAVAGLAARRRDWVAAFRRPSWRRAVIRRLPDGLGRWLLAANRGRRHLVARLRSRWNRSLQLRVVGTTLVLSALVIAVLGFYLVQLTANGLSSSAVNSDGNQV